MTVRRIRVIPDPALRQKAKRVTRINDSTQRLIDDLVETMRAAPGVGLAAPQVGVSLRVIVVEVPEEPLYTLVNPEVVKKSGERRVEEGCLSVPGYKATITRSVSVTVKAQDRTGKPCRIKATGLLAQALEHEIDHLNGILYIDYLSSMDELVPVGASETEEEGALTSGI